jgi:hypothetical protein
LYYGSNKIYASTYSLLFSIHPISFMGAGILPIAFHNGQVYFLLSRECIGSSGDGGKYSDFGGSTEHGESYFQTAVREAHEESDGVLGSPSKIRSLIQHRLLDTITINRYRTYVTEMPYSQTLPSTFRKRFLIIKKQHPEKIATDGFYEKDKLKWVDQRNLHKFLPHVRPWFKPFIKVIQSTNYST